MSMKSKLKGAALASAAAAILATAPMAAMAGSHADVKCMGVNACKGLSSCQTASNACKGHNSCKGQGFVVMSEEACKQVGGTVK